MTMKPEHAIAPMRAVRRYGAKRVHLTDTRRLAAQRRVIVRPKLTEPTLCGQNIPGLSTHVQMVYNAEQITCTDCLVAAIRVKASDQ